MEINLPPDKDVKVEIAESNLLTLRISEKGEYYWNTGIESLKKLERAELPKFLKEKALANPKLTVLVKVDRQGKFEMMVNTIDQLNESQILRFSIAPLLDADKVLMAKVK
jgi:biopolymer transport protein ExbD